MTDKFDLREFRRGFTEGRDPTNVTPMPGSEAVTTRTADWRGLVCMQTGHTFRRGDRVRFGDNLKPALLDPPSELEAPEVREFIAGLEEASGHIGTQRMMIVPGHALLSWAPGRIPRHRCAICGHTLRPYEIVVICPCNPAAPLCGLPVHQDPRQSLACYDAWRQSSERAQFCLANSRRVR